MQADKMFSKVTVTSGRTILSVASIIIASRVFDFKLTSLPLIAQTELSEELLLKLAIPLIVFLGIAHAINWFSDHSGHLFDRLSEFQDSFAEMGLSPPTISDAAMSRYSEWRAAYHSDPASPDDEVAKGIANDRLIKIETALQASSKALAKFRIYSSISEYIAFYIQHLLLPLGFGAWALWITWTKVY